MDIDLTGEFPVIDMTDRGANVNGLGAENEARRRQIVAPIDVVGAPRMFDPPDDAERERLRLIEQRTQRRIRLLLVGLRPEDPAAETDEPRRWSPALVAFILLSIRAVLGGMMIGLFGWAVLPFLIVLFVFEKIVGPTEDLVEKRLRSERGVR